MTNILRVGIRLLCALATCGVALAQTPEWIWFNKTTESEVRYFRKTFEAAGEVEKATLTATADDGLEVSINGTVALKGGEWSKAYTVDVAKLVKPGRNVLAIKAHNGDGSPAGAVARLVLATGSGAKTIVTDGSWKGSDRKQAAWDQPEFDDAAWTAAKPLGALGMQPWGNVFANQTRGSAKGGSSRDPAAAADLHVLPGFAVELIHSGDPEEGSWVNLCKDGQGRLIISPQYQSPNPVGGLLRVTLDARGQVAKRDKIAQPLYDAQGMVYANGALWVVVNKYSTKLESGLYRITDDGSDTYSKIELVLAFPGGGEHGPHAVELGPDGNLWVLAGNHTKVPGSVAKDSPYRNYGEDHALPRQWDGNGHAAGVLAPGGYVLRGTPDGKNFELFCAGFRNPYDITFNMDGELFTFDADMEWDWGMPWYRPTRVNHCVSGGEYGWRSGTGKWPAYYADSLGAVDIGIGCPTGVGNGIGAMFPEKYQRALYVMDWTFGRLIAVHLTPDGSSYQGTYENFVAPAGLVDPSKPKPPLNLTDLTIGVDGAMYFTTGGRNTASGLYRVTYTGAESVKLARGANPAGAEARAARRGLEKLHRSTAPGSIGKLWESMGSPDRATRFAARVALEARPVADWKAQALAETDAETGLNALLALARVGGKASQEETLKGLARWPLASLDERLRLVKLRVIQVSLARNGLPSPALVSMANEKLSASYPNASPLVNHEISQILIALGADDVVGKTLHMMAAAATQEEMIHYLLHLRTAKTWTAQQREEYLNYWTLDKSGMAHPAEVAKWFEEAGRPYADGASFANFLKNFLKEAVDQMSPEEKARFSTLIAAAGSGKTEKEVNPFPAPLARQHVAEWAMEDLQNDLAEPLTNRNFERGRQAFVDAQCFACHKMGRHGGGVGPDLTALSARFTRGDLLESTLAPSKVVSEQYQNTTVVLRNGDDVTGRLVDESGETLTLLPNQLEPTLRVTVAKGDIASRSFSKLSPMPEGLLNSLGKEEILDLLAFIEAGGRKNARNFK